ncbi:hypothetical protein Y1Q_0009259 [Alligator mississippiensis]|uniref:Secreted protein n=1 Tax=Alligator mississippiensis TaxID=8496 RepID=A0A151M2W9_ALLMI|nr:hypothetical protein Y1Q_0009259 [Alligator mississippiensis]
MNPCLAFVLLKLAMPASVWHVSHLFGVGKATAREPVLEAQDHHLFCGKLKELEIVMKLQKCKIDHRKPSNFLCLILEPVKLNW